MAAALIAVVAFAVGAARVLYPYAEPYLSRAATRLRSLRLRPTAVSSLISKPLENRTEAVLYVNNKP